MKKGLTILIIAMVLTAIFGMVGSVAAADMNIETELQISGNGSFNRDMAVQTEKGYAGKTLTETYYTRWIGTDGNSQLRYDSSLAVFMGNSTEFDNETITEVSYAQTAISTNAKQLVCSQNYDIGASQGFYSKGATAKSFELGMEDYISEFEIEGTVIGRMRLSQKVVDPVTRVVHLDEDTQLDGVYDFAWSAYAEDLSYPEGEEDWLGCP
jgi:hypothetical protein